MSLIHLMLFNILYYVIRIALTFLDHVFWIYRRTWNFIRNIFLNSPSESELITIYKMRASTFNKLPKHIGFVINEEVNLTQVAKLLVWCIGVGIENISIFDSDDYLKREKSSLYAKTREVLEKSLPTTCVPKLLFHSSNTSSEPYRNTVFPDTPTKNSFVDDTNSEGSRDINVLIVGSTDGRPGLAEVAKSICQNVQAKKFDPKNVDKGLLSKNLHAFQRADPDLVLCFGNSRSLSGYLPWNVHLSEISFHSSHKRYELCDFMGSLGTFNKCEQRFGK